MANIDRIREALPGTRPASKNQPSRNHIIRPFIKMAIVRLALWGLLPVELAEWLIQRGGLRHV